MRERLSAAHADAEGLPAADEELAGLPAVRALIAGELEKINADFAQYAKIKNFFLLGREWTADGGD